MLVKIVTVGGSIYHIGPSRKVYINGVYYPSLKLSGSGSDAAASLLPGETFVLVNEEDPEDSRSSKPIVMTVPLTRNQSALFEFVAQAENCAWIGIVGEILFEGLDVVVVPGSRLNRGSNCVVVRDSTVKGVQPAFIWKNGRIEPFGYNGPSMSVADFIQYLRGVKRNNPPSDTWIDDVYNV